MEWKTEYRNALLDMSTNPPNVRDRSEERRVGKEC